MAPGDRATILANPPAVRALFKAYNPQSGETTSLYWDGSAWWESSAYWGPASAAPDMGAIQSGNCAGLNFASIVDKRLSQVRLGGYSNALDGSASSKGAIKAEDDARTGDVEAYLWSTSTLKWRRLLAGVALRNDNTPAAPGLLTEDFMVPINLLTGRSPLKDGLGTPFIQRGATSMGAIQEVVA